MYQKGPNVAVSRQNNKKYIYLGELTSMFYETKFIEQFELFLSFKGTNKYLYCATSIY